MITDRLIARWRLHSQCLAAPHAASALAVIRHLLAVQGENIGPTAWALASRTEHRGSDELQQLLADGTVVRTHVLRSTWHLVPAEDVGWLLDLTSPRIRQVPIRSLQDTCGWGPAEIHRATSVIAAELTRQPDQTRAQLTERLAEQGVVANGPGMMFLTALLEMEQLICSGRPLQGNHTYAMFADRVKATRTLTRDEALGELALRYFTGHGPATERDLAYWATLSARDVRRGLAEVRHQLDSFEHDGSVFWHAAGAVPPTGQPEPTGHLLQILDEMYRGYQDSRMVLDGEGVFPKGAERMLGMALVDAQIVGGFRRTAGRRLVFELTPYRAALPEAERTALEQAAARYGEFLGLDAELLVL